MEAGQVEVVVPKGVRKMKLNEKALANALAVFMGIVYLFCALAVVLFPGIFRAVTESWFHGIDIGLIWTGATRPNFLLGLVTAVVLSWIGGWLFAWIYNRFAK